jgi:NAD(P)-dependent dehydrogenase (short-subunit alcohol dehydrogenase family)
VQNAFARLDEGGITVDILVNNAGIQLRKPILDLQRAEWQTVLDTNLTSAFLVGREAARRMIERGRGGKIINIGSLTSEGARRSPQRPPGNPVSAIGPRDDPRFPQGWVCLNGIRQLPAVHIRHLNIQQSRLYGFSVAAASHLERFPAARSGFHLHFPCVELVTDNAAIGDIIDAKRASRWLSTIIRKYDDDVCVIHDL